MERNTASGEFEAIGANPIDLNALREEFKRLRRERRISQAEVAERLHASQATISAFEKGTYTRIRKAMLRGIIWYVSVWKQDREKIVKGPFQGTVKGMGSADFGAQDTASRRVSPENSGLSICAHCNHEIPDLGAPASYCPFCSKPLAHTCECGSVISDPQANFCAQCGRSLVRDGESPHMYPRLGNEKEVQRLVLLRWLVSWFDKPGSVDALVESMRKSREAEKSASS